MKVNRPIKLIIIVIFIGIHHASFAFHDPPLKNDLGGNLVRLSDLSPHQYHYESKARIIQFWASWCHSCGSILWDIDKILDNHPDVEYLAVSIDDNFQSALNYIKKHSLYKKYTKSFYHDTQHQLKKRFEVDTIPSIFVINKLDKVVYRHQGHLNSTDLNILNQQLTQAQEDKP